MSGVYTYCLTGPGEHPTANLVGLGGRPVTGLEVGPFTAWLSEMDQPPTLDLDAISTHHEVVAAAMEHASPVPMRYGAWAASLHTVERRILDRHAELEQALSTLRGRVEYGVRVIGSTRPASEAQEPPTPVDGRSYLRVLSRRNADRRARRAKLREVAASIGAQVEGLRCEERIRFVEDQEVVALAHLVDRGVASEYLGRIRAFVETMREGYQAHVTGPWPAYSFVSA